MKANKIICFTGKPYWASKLELVDLHLSSRWCNSKLLYKSLCTVVTSLRCLCVCPTGGCTTSQGKHTFCLHDYIPNIIIHNILKSITSLLRHCRYRLSVGWIWECVSSQFHHHEIFCEKRDQRSPEI